MSSSDSAARPSLGFCFAEDTLLEVFAHFKTLTFISLSNHWTAGRKKEHFSKSMYPASISHLCHSHLHPYLPEEKSLFCCKTTSHWGPIQVGLIPQKPPGHPVQLTATTRNPISLSHCNLWSSVLGFYPSPSQLASCRWALHLWWFQTSSNFLPECILRQFMSTFLG